MAVFVFLLYLSAGVLVSLAVVPMGEEGKKFFLFNGALALALGASALLLRALPGFGDTVAISNPALTSGVAAMVLLAAYLLLGAFRSESRWLLRVSAALAIIAVALDAAELHAASDTIRHVFNAVTSAWLVGAILLAMILGHFYLVIPKLSIDPLRRLFFFALGGLAARVVLFTIAGVVWWTAGGEHAITIGGFLSRGVFVLQRALFGLVLPASLAWITYKTIEMRSTQSATGILYVVVFLTLVGEALSVYLSLETAIPL